MSDQILKIKGLRDLDKRILKNLIEDSHQPLSNIANKIGTTRQNVSQRIKKLQEKKLIKSYTITVNNQIIEELKVKAYILFREDPNIAIRKKNEKIITKIPQITDFARLFGKYDGIIEVLVKDNNEVTEIINMLHKMKGIKETETFIVHNIIKEDKKAPILDLISD
ncbi:MAG: Lrp/AsnC family transcriptional regulator [Candidatus Helarchaeota archaeon]